MARGFLSGFMWGGVASAVGAIALAIQAGPPRPDADQVAYLSVPLVSGFSRGVEDGPADEDGAARQAVPKADTPRAAAPGIDDFVPLPEGDRRAAAQPAPTPAPDGIAALPGEGRPAPALDSRADAAPGSARVSVPGIPETETEPARPSSGPAPDA
ncbi:MAG: hypothetical protein ACLFQL_09760, partial [Paracoccaceae bacterium]